MFCEQTHGGRSKENAERKQAAKFIVQTGKQLGCQKRVAAQVKKVVVDADRPHIQYFLPNLHDLFFHFLVLRRFIRLV